MNNPAKKLAFSRRRDRQIVREALDADAAHRLLTAIEVDEAKRLADANNLGVHRILDARVAQVPLVHGEDLATFLRRVADEVEMIDDTPLSYASSMAAVVTHVQIEWEMNEGWSACLVIE